jgi:hypothetical protein
MISGAAPSRFGGQKVLFAHGVIRDKLAISGVERRFTVNCL